MNARLMMGAIAVALTLTQAAQAGTLKVGDPAPAMKVAKWVKGTPVAKFDPSKLYVVEFWATWCGPCKESIPHLTEMAKKFKQVSFSGISVWENQGEDKSTAYQAKVVKFVKDMGAKMDYNVGYDGPNGDMASTWMKAANQNGIPTAFIIQKGQIAWIGHPMEMEPVLSKVIDGTFDSKAYAEAQAKAAAAQAEMQKLMGPVMEAANSGDFKKALEEIDKVMAAKPEMKEQLYMFRLATLQRVDEKQYYAYAAELADGPMKDDAMALNSIAWEMVDDESPLKTRDYDTAIKIADRANEVSEGKNSMILDTAAYAYFKAGKIDKAIELQEKAVANLDKTEGVTDEIKKDVKDRLAKFKKAKGG